MRRVDTFAHIVLAAANEVTMMIARANDPPQRSTPKQASSPTSPIACRTVRPHPRCRPAPRTEPERCEPACIQMQLRQCLDERSGCVADEGVNRRS